MPVIRGQPKLEKLSPSQRDALIAELSQERAGKPVPTRPVIYEIPLEQDDRIDILVVWESFRDVRSEDRSEIILEAYQELKTKIVQPLGVTYDEAMEQGLLPYAVVPMVRRGEVDEAILRQTLVEEGAFQLKGEKLDLRFPTMRMAEEVHRRLVDKLPNGYWSIMYTAATVYE